MTFTGDLIESLELPEAQSRENCVLECLSVLEHVFPLQTKHDTYVPHGTLVLTDKARKRQYFTI